MESLARRLGRRHAILTGHATTAIWLTLEHIAERHGTGEVIIPALLCPSVAQVVMYAGFRLRIADVRTSDFTIDPDSVAALVGPDTRMIIPVHLFGHTAEVHRLKQLAPYAMILEDAAQSLGASLGDVPHGALGDAAVLSFGGTKTLNVGGGGALLTDDSDLAAFVEQRLAALPAYAPDELLALSHRNLYHGLMDLVRARPTTRVGPSLRAVVDAYRPLYRHQFPAPALARLASGLDGLAARMRERLARAELTHAALARIPQLAQNRAWADSGACWRYSFLAPSPEAGLAITSALRRAGINASNHYFSLARLFDDAELPNAEFVHRRIINLWVDEVATAEYISRSVQIIGEVTARERSP